VPNIEIEKEINYFHGINSPGRKLYVQAIFFYDVLFERNDEQDRKWLPCP
jgi:hypothetical protein